MRWNPHLSLSLLRQNLKANQSLQSKNKKEKPKNPKMSKRWKQRSLKAGVFWFCIWMSLTLSNSTDNDSENNIKNPSPLLQWRFRAPKKTKKKKKRNYKTPENKIVGNSSMYRYTNSIHICFICLPLPVPLSSDLENLELGSQAKPQKDPKFDQRKQKKRAEELNFLSSFSKLPLASSPSKSF